MADSGPAGNSPVSAITPEEILDRVADHWRPRKMRELATSLLRLADSVDDNWRPPDKNSVFRWPNKLSRIERNAYNLAEKAAQFYIRRRRRAEFLPPSLLAEPAWDMLLELFQQYAGGAKVSTKSLCGASACPATTALRYIGELEATGLVKRTAGISDKRVMFVELTDKGVLAMGSYLEEV